MEPSGADGSPEAGSAVSQEPVKRLKKPVKPDKEAHKAAVDELKEQMNGRRMRADALKQQIDQRRQHGGSPEMIEARSKQSALNGSWRNEADRKNGLREQLKALDNTRNGLRAQTRDQRNKLGAFTTVQKIEERFKTLEHRLEHTTVELKEELRAREEMRKTKALKPLAAAYVDSQEKLKASDKERESISEQMRTLEEKINAIKQQERQQQEIVNELRQKEAAKTQDVPAMIKERDECREIQAALQRKITELMEEFRAQNGEYLKEFNAFKEQQNQDRAERNALREKEYQARQADRQAAAAEFAGEPYHKEVGLCDQLLSHLAKYSQPTQADCGPTTSAAAKESSSPFEGMKAVSKDKQLDDEFGVYMGSGNKKGKGKKAKKESSGTSAGSSQKLNHSLDMLDAFSKLKVKVPTTTDQVPTAVEEVQGSKSYWLKKRQEVKDTGVMPEEPSTSTPNGLSKPPKDTKIKPSNVFSIDDADFPAMGGLPATLQSVSVNDKLHETEGLVKLTFVYTDGAVKLVVS